MGKHAFDFSEYIAAQMDQKIQRTKLYKYYTEKSFLEDIKKERDEDVHSSFLAMVFKKYLEDGHTIERLGEILESRAGKESKKLPDINWKELSLIDVIQEDAFKGDNKNGRIDIIIRCEDKDNKKVNIFIENKVCSHEHTNKASKGGQTLAYYNHYTDKYKGDTNIFVFLTPLDSIRLDEYKELDKKEKCSCEEFIQINYQDILDYILLKLPPFQKPGNSRDKVILQEYIKSLSIPSPDQTKRKRRIVMAVTPKAKDAAKEFWKKNQDLIKFALDSMREDDTITDEDRKAFKDFSDFLDKFKANDDTLFSIEGIEEPVNKRNMVYKFCEAYLKKYPEKGLVDLKGIFNDIRTFVDDKEFARSKELQNGIWVYTNIGSTSPFYEKLKKRLLENKEIKVTISQ